MNCNAFVQLMYYHKIITVTSLWVQWHLKSPASGLFTQPFIQAQIKENIKLRVTGLCAGNSPWPVNSPHKGPVTQKMFPFDDVIMVCIHIYIDTFSRSTFVMVYFDSNGLHKTYILHIAHKGILLCKYHEVNIYIIMCNKIINNSSFISSVIKYFQDIYCDSK